MMISKPGRGNTATTRARRPEREVRKPPLLWPPRGLSDQETDAIKWLSASMYGLLASVDAWDAALKLYKFAKARPQEIHHDLARRWRWIAIHECVMQIAFLRERLDGIRGRIGESIRVCPRFAAWKLPFRRHLIVSARVQSILCYIAGRVREKLRGNLTAWPVLRNASAERGEAGPSRGENQATSGTGW